VGTFSTVASGKCTKTLTWENFSFSFFFCQCVPLVWRDPAAQTAIRTGSGGEKELGRQRMRVFELCKMEQPVYM
jgi:hypothetical protein